MKSDSLGTAFAVAAPRYSDPSLQRLQERFDALAETGAEPAELKRFLSKVFVERNRAIRNQDYRKLAPASVAEDFLLPRRDLFAFLVENWISRIFLPSLKEETVESMLVFGLGRLFSSYNDTGVQRSTDADINVVVRDGLSASRRAELREALYLLKRELFEHFKINLEVDPSFTLLREKEIQARLEAADGATRLGNLLFYKSNSRSARIIKDEADLRASVFSRVARLPDALLFENFLGLANPKVSFMKLLTGESALPILADGSCEKIEAASVIGSRPFSFRFHRLVPRRLLVAPPDWHFSMKYFVNRVYDYVGAMRNLGHGLGELGLGEVSPELGVDPDYRFLRNAHRMMLYLQELEELSARSFNADCDYSYVSRARFMRFIEIDGDKFKRDFVDMAVKGDLLLASEKAAFRALKRKIETKARDRFLSGRAAELKLLPPGLAYETVFKDKSDFKIRLPYSWSDLGYFVFDRIAARMERIVLGKLVPPLSGLGMPEKDHRRYLELAKEAWAQEA